MVFYMILFLFTLFISITTGYAAILDFDRPNEYTLTAKLSDNLHFVCEKIEPSDHCSSLD